MIILFILKRRIPKLGNHYIGERPVTDEEWQKHLDDICNPIMQGEISPLSVAAELLRRFNDQMNDLSEITK